MVTFSVCTFSVGDQRIAIIHMGVEVLFLKMLKLFNLNYDTILLSNTILSSFNTT